MNLATGIQKAIDFIEEHITDELDMAKVARQAAAAVRRATDVPNGKQYRKYYCSWNISDHSWIEKKYTRDEFRRKWFDTAHCNTDKWGYDWFKDYRTKFRNWREAYRAYIRYNKTK